MTDSNGIDYRDLLKRYMYVIIVHEGDEYIHYGIESPMIGIDHFVRFSKEEVEELKQISKEAYGIESINPVPLDS